MVHWICSREGLEPQFWTDVDDLLRTSPYIWNVIYGFRTLAEQEKLYKIHLEGGPLAAPPGKSAHNFGLAVDVQLFKPGTDDLEWNVKAAGWQWLFTNIEPTPRLHSGIAFGDFDHIERFNWKAFKTWNKEKSASN